MNDHLKNPKRIAEQTGEQRDDFTRSRSFALYAYHMYVLPLLAHRACYFYESEARFLTTMTYPVITKDSRIKAEHNGVIAVQKRRFAYNDGLAYVRFEKWRLTSTKTGEMINSRGWYVTEIGSQRKDPMQKFRFASEPSLQDEIEIKRTYHRMKNKYSMNEPVFLRHLQAEFGERYSYGGSRFEVAWNNLIHQMFDPKYQFPCWPHRHYIVDESPGD